MREGDCDVSRDKGGHDVSLKQGFCNVSRDQGAVMCYESSGL